MVAKEDLEIKKLEKKIQIYDEVLEAIKKGKIDMASLVRALADRDVNVNEGCPCHYPVD